MTSPADLGAFAKIPLTIDVALDCGTYPLGEVSGWTEGSVIRSAHAAGDNLEIRVGGKLVGSGELVPIEGSLALRITSLKGNA
jgi:flagellar motor switch/type III secretory pathway protein FliN